MLVCIAQQPAVAADDPRPDSPGIAVGPTDPPDDPCVPGTACDPVYCDTPSTCPAAIGTFIGRYNKSDQVYGSTYTYSVEYDPENGNFPHYQFHDWGFFPEVVYDDYCQDVIHQYPDSCGYSTSYPVIRLDHWQFDIHDRDNYWGHPDFENWHTGFQGQTIVKPASGTSGGRQGCISSGSYRTWCMNSLYEAEAWYDGPATSPCVSLAGNMVTPPIAEPGWTGGLENVSSNMPRIIDNGVCR